MQSWCNPGASWCKLAVDVVALPTTLYSTELASLLLPMSLCHSSCQCPCFTPPANVLVSLLLSMSLCHSCQCPCVTPPVIVFVSLFLSLCLCQSSCHGPCVIPPVYVLVSLFRYVSVLYNTCLPLHNAVHFVTGGVGNVWHILKSVLLVIKRM